MPLFLSTSRHKIDKKGRVSVPASFRDELQGEPLEVALAPALDDAPCIEGFTRPTVARLAAAIDRMNPLSAQRDALAARVLGRIVLTRLDPEGRVVLPEALIAHAHLEEEAVFVGLGAKFRIWSPARHEEAMTAARDVALGAIPGLPWADDAIGGGG